MAAIILAAGQSRRFEGIKQLAIINGQPIISSVIQQYKQIMVDDLYVVLGAYSQKIENVLPAGVRILHSDQWQQGIGHSIASAVGQLQVLYSHILIGLADQVAMTAGHLQRLTEAAVQYPEHIIATDYGQHIGVPAIFAKQDFADLSQLQGDSGAKLLIQQNRHRLTTITGKQAAFDIDTRGDLQQWQRMQQEELK